ncbi:hypothetical protein E2C01_055595 [Portunus trituberculatus]|uniref:Uncharacterized protein n=1 Tax=Portunus trituberculatus TaxID=210409 RepID=A0A5B7GRM9_PORTR|nr:hypothetical protein [Portunus trituberculatus]
MSGRDGVIFRVLGQAGAGRGGEHSISQGEGRTCTLRRRGGDTSGNLFGCSVIPWCVCVCRGLAGETPWRNTSRLHVTQREAAAPGVRSRVAVWQTRSPPHLAERRLQAASRVTGHLLLLEY